MKIGFFIGSLNFGGAERVVANLANYMCHNNHQVLVITKIKTDSEYDLEKNIKRVVLEKSLKTNGLWNQFLILKALNQILKEEVLDLLVTFTSNPNFRGIICARKLNIPVIVSVRSDPKQEYKGVIKWNLANYLFRYANAIVFQTEQAAEYFKERLKAKSYIIPNPLSESCLTLNRVPSNPPRIIAVGRLDDNKNFQLLINAYAHRHLELNGYQLVIFGEGSNRKALEELIRNLGMSGKISLPGITKDSLSELRKSDIFILTSNYEGMPNALMEAMSQGLTVIATDCPCGGSAFLINHRENGILIPVGGRTELEESLVEVCNNEVLRTQLGRNARQIIRRLDPQVIYSSWIKCFDEVLKGKKKL